MRDKLQCQKSSSKSSLESEAKANGEGAMDGIHKRELAKDFGVEVTTTNFWTDSESSRKLHSDLYACKKSKHIIRVISQLREWVLNLVYAIRHIPGSQNYADILTKPLPMAQFSKFRDAVLNAQVVFPSTTTVQSAHYAETLRKLLTYGD